MAHFMNDLYLVYKTCVITDAATSRLSLKQTILTPIAEMLQVIMAACKCCFADARISRSEQSFIWSKELTATDLFFKYLHFQ